MNIEFVNKCLINVKWNKDNNEIVEGIIKKLSNEYLKFDIRYLSNFSEERKGKLIDSKSDADKILFENDKEWILIDTKEFIKYMEINNLKEIRLDDLISKIDWSIIIKK